jgi:hypothetical protein
MSEFGLILAVSAPLAWDFNVNFSVKHWRPRSVLCQTYLGMLALFESQLFSPARCVFPKGPGR